MLRITLFLLLGLNVAAQVRNTVWHEKRGAWPETAFWSAGVPDGLARTAITGAAEVVISSEGQICGGLAVGASRGDDARLLLKGGSLVVRRNFVQIGELAEGAGEIVVENGALHSCGPVYIAAANGALRSCSGTLRVRGGSVVARLFTLGWGAGSTARLAIEGSRAEAVEALDYITAGCYDEKLASTSTLAFTLDERGVTPITIRSPRGGLSLLNEAAPNVCRLEILLSAVPPREDVTLTAANVPTRGHFEDLPEGAEIRATHAGRVFRWTLTYKGGANGHHVVLRNVRGHLASDAVTHTRPLPAEQALLWKTMPLRAPLPESFEPAFEGAHGFGAIAAGGRGGREIAVENLADSGPGSLRAALEVKEPRVIVFKVGGEIVLKSRLRITEPFASVLGQTAPAPGITLSRHGILVQTHDVVLRHLRIHGSVGAEGGDVMEFYDAERCIADHCSFLWDDDETCSITGLSDAITIQHCLIAEGLNHAGHSMGGIAGGERTSWHHNVIAHCRTRNPRFAGQTWCDFRHNVIYDWGDAAAYGEFERVNLVGNFFKPGPSTKYLPPVIFQSDAALPAASLFSADNTPMTLKCDAAVLSTQPFPAPTVPGDAAEHALEKVGATLPLRDAEDARILREVREGTGGIRDR